MSAVDDVFESWEEMEESGALDQKLKALEVNPVDGLKESNNKDCNSDARIIILGGDRMRSPYTPKPTIKILQRPDRNLQGDGSLLNGDKPKQPIKSLKQREQEYAEARKRILGEEKSPEEKVLPEVNRIQGKTLIANGSNVPINVARMPTGPDGTKGFNVRRGRDGYEAESSKVLQVSWIIWGPALLFNIEKCLTAASQEELRNGKHKKNDAFVQSRLNNHDCDDVTI